MTSLGKELHTTIRNLEKLRDSQKPTSDAILKKLDALYGKQIDLIDAAINNRTIEYKNATTAMQKAGNKTMEAIDDLAKLENAIEKVDDAIGKVKDLLSSIA